MKNGDLSNTFPRRLLVALPFVALPPQLSLINRLRRRRNANSIAQHYTLLPSTIGLTLRVAVLHGLIMELFAVGIDLDEVNAVISRLDASQAHPFTHASAYLTHHEFVSTLPYRPEVLGVIDVPERALIYGSHFMPVASMF